MPASLGDTMRGLIDAADALERDAPPRAQLKKIVRRGDFRPSEDEAIGYWFARFLSIRESLWDVIEDVLEVLEKPLDEIQSQRDLRYFLVGYTALCVLLRIDRVMLYEVAYHSIIQRKLNEPFPEYRIPRKQYTTIFSSFVDQGNEIAIRDAMRVAKEHRAKLLALADDPAVGSFAAQLPELERSLNPSKFGYIRRTWRYVSHKWRRRGVVSASNVMASLLEGFGRTASEFYDAENKHVTSDKLQQVAALLRPGDIIVTRHRKALTNLFLPGFWPHVALYIGTVEQRDAMGIRPDWAKMQLWTDDICVLEARKDGVLFRPLTDTFSIDVFAVLRPKLDETNIRQSIERAVLHEGKMYNFDFDFFNSDRIVCTELVYRAYDGIEKIDFPLRERAGRKTLSAEDLLDYALETDNFMPIAIFGVKGCKDQIVTGDGVPEILRQSYRKTS